MDLKYYSLLLDTYNMLDKNASIIYLGLIHVGVFLESYY